MLNNPTIPTIDPLIFITENPEKVSAGVHTTQGAETPRVIENDTTLHLLLLVFLLLVRKIHSNDSPMCNIDS